MSLWSRLLGMVSLGKVESTTAPAGGRGRVKAWVLGVLEDLPRVQPYGFLSRPVGGEVVLFSVGGTRDDLFAFAIGDRRYNIALEAGDVAIVDNRGNKIHLAETGITVHANVVTVDSPDVRLGDGTGGRRRIIREGDTLALAPDGLAAPSGAVSGTIRVNESSQVTAS